MVLMLCSKCHICHTCLAVSVWTLIIFFTSLWNSEVLGSNTACLIRDLEFIQILLYELCLIVSANQVF